jgi:hypothetical protein
MLLLWRHYAVLGYDSNELFNANALHERKLQEQHLPLEAITRWLMKKQLTEKTQMCAVANVYIHELLVLLIVLGCVW